MKTLNVSKRRGHWSRKAANILLVSSIAQFTATTSGELHYVTENRSNTNERSELHTRIEEAIVSLASADDARRQRAVAFLLSTPPVFRQTIDRAYRKEAEAIAKSLPQQIDAYTTADALVITDDTTLFLYTVDFGDHAISTASLNELIETSHDMTVRQHCTEGDYVLLNMLFGRDLVRKYQDRTGAFLFKTRISWSDCENLRR